MSITIKRIISEKDIKKFVQFQIDLYKNNDYYVPPIISDEIKVFDKDDNPVFEHAEASLFLAYKGNTIVGRIAVITNNNEIEMQKVSRLRFGWFDFIDDIEVSTALLEKAASIGKEKGLESIEGPMGFSNMDKAGMLIKGYDHYPTTITIYNFPYYKEHLESLGFQVGSEWLEKKFEMPKVLTKKVLKFISIIKRRYKIKVIPINNKKDLLKWSDEIFNVLELAYSKLESFVPFSEKQKKYYIKKYFKILNPDFISCLADENDKMVAFAITMPHFAKALRKANGKIFPFGWYHLLKASKNNDTMVFFLIGIDPHYQNKGLTSIIFEEMYNGYNKHGVKYIETNPQLEDNKSIQLLWEPYNPIEHKRRRTYRKGI